MLDSLGLTDPVPLTGKDLRSMVKVAEQLAAQTRQLNEYEEAMLGKAADEIRARRLPQDEAQALLRAAQAQVDRRAQEVIEQTLQGLPESLKGKVTAEALLKEDQGPFYESKISCACRRMNDAIEQYENYQKANKEYKENVKLTQLENAIALKSPTPETKEQAIQHVFDTNTTRDSGYALRIKVHGVFEIVDIDGRSTLWEDVDARQDNAGEFYHGTSRKAAQSIIKNGFWDSQDVVTVNGRLLGKGTYLSDAAGKSASPNYITAGKNHSSGRGVLLWCRAAMGTVSENRRDRTAHTIAAKAGSKGWRNRTLKHSEWCVRQGNKAVQPRLWIDVESEVV